MILLDGKTLSEKILSDLKSKIYHLRSTINLDIILIGDSPASLKYVSLKQAKAESIGIGGRLHHFSVSEPPATIFSLIDSLNFDSSVTGFFVQLPLPENYDNNLIVNSIDPSKDADGLNPTSGIVPAVDRGIVRLLTEYKILPSNKNIIIVNDSLLIGQPLKKEFEKLGGKVTLCNEFTSDLGSTTLTSDILISATGVKNLITAPMVKEGIVAIDIGGGDIDFAGVSAKASYITPTFGGVGPMTVISLLENTYDLTVKK
jgi:methylenetetrahydrofolate dehydrogenase (NADP+)/methenyltetrahydrofolate cyclohydrolase